MIKMQLVHDHISRDTKEAVSQIAEGVAAGHVIGIAFVLVLKRKRFMVNTAGVASQDPTHTRGMLCALDDELKRMVQGPASESTTI